MSICVYDKFLLEYLTINLSIYRHIVEIRSTVSTLNHKFRTIGVRGHNFKGHLLPIVLGKLCPFFIY